MDGSPLQFQHTTTVVRVTNLERSQHWFEQILGFHVDYHDPLYRLISMSADGSRSVTIYEIPAGTELVPTSLHGAYIVFMTGTLTSDRDELIRRGAEVTPPECIPGICLCWIVDPDGNRFALMQLLPD